MSTLNTKLLRNLNKVELCTLSGDREEKRYTAKTLFAGYTNSGPSLGVSVGMSDIFEGGHSSFFKRDTWIGKATAFVGNFGLGITGGIDLPAKYMFEGTDQLSFNINGYLLVQNGYKEDVLDPIQALLDFILPTRGEVMNTEQANAFIEKQQANAQANGKKGAYWNILDVGLDTVTKFTGEVYALEVPEQMKTTLAANLDKSTSAVSDKNYCGMRLYWGPMYFDDVIVTNFSIDTPAALMVDVDVNGNVIGPCPDSVKFTLGVKTNRRATADYFKNSCGRR